MPLIEGLLVTRGNFIRMAFISLALLASHGMQARDISDGARGDVETAWRLLDYIAVDYGAAVADGVVTDPVEYREQVEFARTAAAMIAALAPRPEQADLLARSQRLQNAIAEKLDGAQVADIAHELAAALLVAYPVLLAPGAAPDLDRGAQLYAQQCAACHGIGGEGNGPAAVGLTPPPTAFTDAERARQRSVFALYQVVTQGLDDTPMQSYASLPTEDRWALAFHVGQFAFPDTEASEGQRLWRADTSLHAVIPDLKTLTGTTPAVLAAQVGARPADALMAFLRRHPEQVIRPSSGQLTAAREHLAESLAAYQAGDARQAGKLALSAYLDGFEPIEPALGARDSQLLQQIETAMGEYRAAISSSEDAGTLARRVQLLDGLLDEAEAALAPGTSSQLSTFLGAATILLREGLEALLIVVAMIAFLRKAGRVEAMPYVHAGWAGALLAGVLTWIVATWFIGISGASRELTEGIGSVFAALVLLSVGIWMHGKAQADQWQRYIREKLSGALSGRSAWLLFGLAFLVVYREAFETILFFVALWAQGNGAAMLLGASSACVVLAAVALAMLRYSRRLPIDRFFGYSAWLMAFLAVVLAGKGVAALQEAGIVDLSLLSFIPRLEIIGLYPTAQGVGAQLIMIAALLLGFWWNRQQASRPVAAGR